MPGMQTRAVLRLEKDALRRWEALCDKRAARLSQRLRMEDQAVLQKIDRGQQPEGEDGDELKK
jgi:hypothetical protein